MIGTPAYTQLLALLDRLIDLRRELLAASRAEQDAVTKGDVAEVERMTWSKQELVVRMRELEPEQARVIAEAATAVGLPARGTTVAALAAALPAEGGATLRRRRDELLLLASSLDRTNRVTTRLLLRAIDFADASVRWLKEAPDTNPIYAPAGALDRRGGERALMDRLA